MVFHAAMRTWMLILIFATPVTANVFARPDPFDLGVKNLARLMRASTFAERQIRIKKAKPQRCAVILNAPLTYDESHRSCLDCVKMVTAALRVQGFPPADIRYASLGQSLSHYQILTGTRSLLDAHVVTLLRVKDLQGKWRLIFFDPTLIQFADLWAQISWRPVGQEILGELSRYGFWVADEARYRFFLERWKAYLEPPFEAVEFSNLPTLFDHPEENWVNGSDSEAPWRHNLKNELREITLIDLLLRFGDERTVLRFVQEWSNQKLHELDRELDEGVIPDATPRATQVLPEQQAGP